MDLLKVVVVAALCLAKTRRPSCRWITLRFEVTLATPTSLKIRTTSGVLTAGAADLPAAAADLPAGAAAGLPAGAAADLPAAAAAGLPAASTCAVLAEPGVPKPALVIVLQGCFVWVLCRYEISFPRGFLEFTVSGV
jgi:hypothetical protein